MSRPRHSENKPRAGALVLTSAEVKSPSRAIQKNSKLEKLNEARARMGALRSRTTAPTKPPAAEKTMPMPIASCALPLRLSAYASSTYAAEAGVPGMRSSTPGISPAVMAIAVVATMAAMAATGSM